MKIGPIAIRSFIMLFGHIKWHTKRWFDRLHSGWRSDWMRSCQYCFRFRAYESSDPTIRWRTIRANSEWEAIKLEESRLQAIWHLEQKQWKTKAFIDRQHNNKEKLFDIGIPVLVFQMKMGTMPSKLRFRWTGPFWIVNVYNSTYQVGTLAGHVLPKWITGFRLRTYHDLTPANPFQPEMLHIASDRQPNNP